jgi:hypothetical protein
VARRSDGGEESAAADGASMVKVFLLGEEMGR